eukprot:240452_1
MNRKVGKRYVPKTNYKAKKRDPDNMDKKSKNTNYHLSLELNLKNLQDNLQVDYIHSVNLLFEYFSHKTDVTCYDAMNIITQLCAHLHIAPLAKATSGRSIDQLCRFISLLCINHNIEWNCETLNLFISTLITHVLSSLDVVRSCISCLPNIVRTIGHVLFERGNLIAPTNCDDLMSLLIPLCAPNNCTKLRVLPWMAEHVDKLCIYYGMHKFSPKWQNIESFNSWREIGEYITECAANGVATHSKIGEVWKYYINLRKFSMIALGHCIIKSGSSHLLCTKYGALITNCMLVTCHFLKTEFAKYDVNKLCRNEHEFAKSVTPIIRSLSHLFGEYDMTHLIGDDDEDLIIQIIGDLKDLMVLGATTTRREEQQQQPPLTCDYSDYSRNERHRYRNRVLLDWSGDQYGKTKHGYTSDSVLGSAENLDADKSFFVPFDMFSKLRMYIQHSLGLLVKNVTSDDYFSHFWNKLLPKDVTSAISQRPFYGCHILTVLLYDPHPRVRNAACLTLYNLLEICALRISNLLSTKRGRRDRRKQQQITTISDRANETLLALHRGLLFAIDEKEIHSTPRTQILKCLMLLINITDYNKLNEMDEKRPDHVLIAIIGVILRDISQSHGLYKSAVIQLLSAIFSAKYEFEREKTQIGELIKQMMPVLLQEIKKNAQSPNPLCDPRSILVSLAARYRSCLCAWWNKGLQDVISCGFCPTQHYTIILETMKMMNAWLAIIPLSRIDAAAFCDYDDAMFGFLKLNNSCKNLAFWLTQLMNHFALEQSPDCAAIKSKICMLCSTLKPWQFVLLGDAIRHQLLAFLGDALRDTNWPSLRQCACKGVGNLLRCKLTPNDAVFYESLCAILNQILADAIRNGMKKKQQYLLVSKACCAVSSICNYNKQMLQGTKQLFVYNSQTNANDMMNEEIKEEMKINHKKYAYPAAEAREPFTKLVSHKVLDSMMSGIISVCSESKHNIAYNAIRAAGHIAFWLPIETSLYCESWPKICAALSHSLQKDHKLKNQWNACFAAGNALSNPSIAVLRYKPAMEATRELYCTICKLLDQCENYKVKITAVYALTQPNHRKNYGPIYYKLCEICCRALNNIDQLECNGFAKQKYKQLLKFRLINLLKHLVNCAETNKIRKLKQTINLKDQNIQKYCFFKIEQQQQTTVSSPPPK